MDSSEQTLIKNVDAHFIDIVGPIGRLLIEDARHMWRKKQWGGPSAKRNYIKFLAQQIDIPSQKEKFTEQTSQLIMDSASKKFRSISGGN